jgi:hypothetical protein
VRIRLDLRRCDPTLHRATQRREVGLEDPLGLVLWEAALEFTAAVDALESQGAQLGHVRAVQAGASDVLGGLEERRQQADRIQDLEGARLDRCGARLTVRLHLPLDEPHAHSMAGELAGGEQSGRAGADN